MIPIPLREQIHRAPEFFIRSPIVVTALDGHNIAASAVIIRPDGDTMFIVLPFGDQNLIVLQIETPGPQPTTDGNLLGTVLIF
jgi:hypothetical protein